ncbi:MAG: 3-dehydroquinate synthase [Thermoplasmata archaeon]|nr:3-dehydroquinate synthase [Thermoplasmata archaeon]
MDIKIGRGTVSNLRDIVDEMRPYKVAVITDSNVARLHMEALGDLKAVHIILPPGERAKSIEAAIHIWKKMISEEFTRKSLVIGFGGGVITDLAGFVASTFMRGLPLILLPTTLIAQIDAAIGGKTGINFEGKNIIGTFYSPERILIDPDFLKTLPPEEWKNGYGELVKYAILSREIYEMLWKKKDVDEEVIRLCVNYKIGVVKEDMREQGKRRILNLGHTFAHALEKLSGYTIKHGIAVAQGLRFAGILSRKLYGFDPAPLNSLLDAFDISLSLSFKPREILSAMKNDKKFWYGKMVFVLPMDIGRVIIEEVQENLILETLEDMLCSQV